MSSAFETKAGVTLVLSRPNLFDVLHLEQELLKEAPQPPKKKTTTAFGVEDVDDKENPDYQYQFTAWNFAYSRQVLDFYLLEYVQVDVPDSLPEIEQTYRRMQRRGAVPPYDLSDPDDCKVAYLRHLLTNDELVALQVRLRQLRGATEEEIATIEAAFRASLDGSSADGRAGPGAPGGEPAPDGAAVGASGTHRRRRSRGVPSA